MTTAKSTRRTASSAPRKAAPARKSAPNTKSVKPPVAQSAAPLSAPVKPATTKGMTTKTDKKRDKPEKVKVVRDSFTIPKTEYTQISELKKRAIAGGVEVKKSELIRAGLLLLSSQTDAGLRKALHAVPTLKTGRPGKG